MGARRKYSPSCAKVVLLFAFKPTDGVRGWLLLLPATRRHITALRLAFLFLDALPHITSHHAFHANSETTSAST
jgi:hypothetical protein